MPLTKSSVARSQTFFQVDFDPCVKSISKQVPEVYRNRLLLLFTVDALPESNLSDLKDWIQSKWDEIPEIGQKAFFNTLIAFMRTQTVILGENGFHIANKVTNYAPILHNL